MRARISIRIPRAMKLPFELHFSSWFALAHSQPLITTNKIYYLYQTTQNKQTEQQKAKSNRRDGNRDGRIAKEPRVSEGFGFRCRNVHLVISGGVRF